MPAHPPQPTMDQPPASTSPLLVSPTPYLNHHQVTVTTTMDDRQSDSHLIKHNISTITSTSIIIDEPDYSADPRPISHDSQESDMAGTQSSQPIAVCLVHRTKTRIDEDSQPSSSSGLKSPADWTKHHGKRTQAERKRTPEKSPSKRSDDRKSKNESDSDEIDDKDICWRPTTNRVPALPHEIEHVSFDRLRNNYNESSQMSDSREKVQETYAANASCAHSNRVMTNVTTNEQFALDLASRNRCTKKYEIKNSEKYCNLRCPSASNRPDSRSCVSPTHCLHASASPAFERIVEGSSQEGLSINRSHVSPSRTNKDWRNISPSQKCQRSPRKDANIIETQEREEDTKYQKVKSSNIGELWDYIGKLWDYIGELWD